MLEPVLKRPLQPVSQRLRGLLRHLVTPLVAAAVVFFGLGSYWSIEPAVFDIREMALRQSGNDPKTLVPGAVTTATLIEVASTLLEKRGGFLSNDINPISLWLDNIPNWEYGALVQVRDLTRVLRNDFSRSQTQSIEDRNLAIADPQFHFNNESWIFPTTESQYREGIEALKRYLALLEDPSRREGRFFVRIDSLRHWLGLVATRLGDLAHRLSASVGVKNLDTYAIWNLEAGKAATKSKEPRYKTPWLKTDDVFYEARGATWALLHFMYAIQIDFAQVLNDKKGMVSIQQITRKLAEAHKPVWSPMILNGTGYGVTANHSLVMASYISRAGAAVVDLLNLLQQG
ncbi:MAG TPA: DUF2333 family protein [Gammaproteobacteria bacterium]|nr:DUF2333 family protein [Gammaproteobacteria bacterium]